MTEKATGSVWLSLYSHKQLKFPRLRTGFVTIAAQSLSVKIRRFKLDGRQMLNGINHFKMHDYHRSCYLMGCCPASRCHADAKNLIFPLLTHFMLEIIPFDDGLPLIWKSPKYVLLGVTFQFLPISTYWHCWNYNNTNNRKCNYVKVVKLDSYPNSLRIHRYWIFLSTTQFSATYTWLNLK